MNLVFSKISKWSFDHFNNAKATSTGKFNEL